MTLLSMTIAFNVEMARQFSSLVLSAWDQSLDAVSNSERMANTSRSDLSGAQPATAAAKLRVVVDNMPSAQETTKVAEKGTKKTSKSVEPAVKSGRISTSVDDLKRISGIGPKLEKLLHDKGIRQFSDVAKLSAAKVNNLDSELSLGGRIIRDQWIEKAKALVKEQA